jgi:hypothetical protein
MKKSEPRIKTGLPFEQGRMKTNGSRVCDPGRRRLCCRFFGSVLLPDPEMIRPNGQSRTMLSAGGRN